MNVDVICGFMDDIVYVCSDVLNIIYIYICMYDTI